MSVFKIDSTSLLMREYVRKQSQGGGGSSLQIKTADGYDEYIDINETYFTGQNVSFVNGNVIAGAPNEDHAVFGSSDGTRRVTTTQTYNLIMGTYVSIQCIRGEATGGSIVLEDDPDDDEDLIIEVSTDNITFTRLIGRITDRNSSNTSYIEFRFLMTGNTGDYYIRIRQTEHSDEETDYYAIKNLRINVNTCIFDPVTKIAVF
jgi:hypothetical protein